jgi:alpha-L-fucosidase
VDNSDKHRAGEMCQVLNDHWGYAADDCNYKSVKELIENLIDCRKFGCNFLLNTGLRGDGSVSPMDACVLGEIGKWTKKYGEAIYNVKVCENSVKNSIKLSENSVKNAVLLQGEDCYYVIVKNVPMSADPNVQRVESVGQVCVEGEILSAEWLDNGEKIETDKGSFYVVPFGYGTSYSSRVAKLKIQ